MIKIKHGRKTICGLNERYRVVKDMFSNGNLQGVYTTDGSELLDVSYLRKGDKIPVEYEDVWNIYTYMKSMNEEGTYCSDPDENEYIKELIESLEEACKTFKDDDFKLICE